MAPTFNLSGRNQYNELRPALDDRSPAAFWRIRDHDGQSAAGADHPPSPSIADWEVNEQKTRLVYLYRRWPSTPGAAAARAVQRPRSRSTWLCKRPALVMTHGRRFTTTIFGTIRGTAAHVRQSMLWSLHTTSRRSLVNLGQSRGISSRNTTSSLYVAGRRGHRRSTGTA